MQEYLGRLEDIMPTLESNRKENFKPTKEQILEIIELYTLSMYTLRHISEIFDTNHHFIKRLLLSNDIAVGRRRTKNQLVKIKLNQVRNYPLSILIGLIMEEKLQKRLYIKI